MKIYYKRIADRILERKLAGKGAVLIQGAKWCGKTTTAEQFAKSVAYLADPDTFELANISAKQVLMGTNPRLIDEWQVVPQIWDAARFEIDHRNQNGLFIFTGSAVPPDSDKIIHTGTGRFAWLTMRTMSLFESGDSSGDISLKDLFDNKPDLFGKSDMDIERLAFLICRGGWPRNAGDLSDIALDSSFDYVDAVINSDIIRADNINRNPATTSRIMKAFARHQGSQVSYNSIRNDIVSNESESLSTDTVVSYINALKRIFVIEDVAAWNPNLRSKTAIRTSDTRYFSDPSIATAILGLGPSDLLNALNTMGFLLETLCIRDLRVYASAIDGQVYHYRDKTGLECDAVIHLRNGNYGLIEIKLGGERLIRQGVESLKHVAEKIDVDKMKAPSFLMVLTGVGKYAYRREDGVYVVPISCLKD